MAFFSSTDCPKCESAKLLIEALKSKYRVRVKTFDVERDKDYSLFKAVQAIHSSGGLSVPLILVGDVILAGEEEIDAKLEETVRGLAKAGGAELPYLGPDHTAPAPTKRDKCDFDKNRPGRPPSAPEEWGKFRSFLDYFF
jgi:glutaredoxin